MNATENRMKTDKQMWLLFAIGSALFAALTAVLAKIGVTNVNSNIATAISCIVITLISWTIVLCQGHGSDISFISAKSWIFLILSGITTGFSWLCYFRALQLGEVSKVVPIDKLSTVMTIILALVIFHETFTFKTAVGMLMITIGTLFMTL